MSGKGSGQRPCLISKDQFRDNWDNIFSKKENIETIVGVYVIHKGILYDLPKPNRHHNCIHLAHEKTGDFNIGSKFQGFVTSTGRYVNREEALDIATKANQIIIKTNPIDSLFSEDVW